MTVHHPPTLPTSRETGDQPASIRPVASWGWAVQIVHRAAIACTVLAGLALSGLFVEAGARTVGVAWPVTHPEGATIAAILRVRDGEPLYQDFQQFPHVITPYPPVQPVVAGLFSRLLDLSVLETAGLARGLTLAASLFATLLIWLIARQCGARPLAALAGASLLLPLPFLDEWGSAARPDLPAIALSLLALLLLLVKPERVWLAAGVAALAFLTKQTAVVVPVVAVAWLLLTWRWRAAAIFAGTWAALIGGTMLVLELVTGGTYLLNTVYAHLATPKNDFDLAIRDFMPLLADDWPAMVLALGAVLLLARDRRPLLPLLYLGASSGLALVALRNTGGDVNYLIEPVAAACVPAALAIDWLWRTDGRSRPPADAVDLPARARNAVLPWLRLAGSVALAAAILVWGSGIWEFWRLDGGVNVARLPLEEIAASERVLSEEPLAVLLAGQPLLVSDLFHLSMLTTSGFFDPLDLERRIKESEFDLIVMRNDVRAARSWKRQLLLPDGVRLAIKDVYVPAGRVGIFWLYRPED